MSDIDMRELPELRVCVVEKGGRGRAGWQRCEIETNLRFSLEDMAAYFYARWEPIVFDTMLVAAAVEFCDKIMKRPPLGWAREIYLHVPVDAPEHWASGAVSEALHAALNLLTGDRWHITFGKRRRASAQPSQNTMPFDPGMAAVMPFSDGLDSCAVSALMDETYGSGLVRMRLGPKKRDQPISASGRKQPFQAVPYQVKTNGKAPEATGRSRGFKFAILSGLAAYLAKAPAVIVSESGQGAVGPVLVPVGHAHEDYRNHPVFMAMMTEFLDVLLGYKIKFLFPRLWHTKGETLAEYAALGRSDWKDTRSCWQDNRQVSVDRHRRQCGICAACMLRRMSLHAAQLQEAPDVYIWDDLSQPDFEPAAASGFKGGKKIKKQYAIAGALHLHHMAGLRKSALSKQTLELNAFHLSRVLDLPKAEVAQKVDRMLGQHEQEWSAFTNALGKESFVLEWVGQ
jgi:hypothetical protein